MRSNIRNIVLLLACILLLSGCSLPFGINVPTPTPELPEGLTFIAPFAASLDPGETIPGTGLAFQEKAEDEIRVLIDGQAAVKKVGDSFNWLGSPAAGVEVAYKLRVMGVILGSLRAVGDVHVTMHDVQPIPEETPEEAPLMFRAAVATHTVPKGTIIPGTSITYLGKTDKGAQFEGIEGYPYREIADSLEWSGRVRDNTLVDITMRVSS
ncbi:MAG: hypothetical protein ABFQ89_06545, partial [Chloroflexota bacterium]